MAKDTKNSFSLYVMGMPSEAKERYRKKLGFGVSGTILPDPYIIKDENWSTDPTLWPELDFGQIYTYLVETPSIFDKKSMKAYKSLEAYRYVESGHVEEVKAFDVKEAPYCFLKAGVLPSMRTKEKAHQPWVCLHKTSADIFCAHCTCAAGLGEACSHIAALLFKVELGVRYGINKTSVTSEACKWNKVFKKEIKPTTVDNIQGLVNSNRKKKVESFTPSSRDPLPDSSALTSFHKICPYAAFFNLIPPLPGICQQSTTSEKLSEKLSENNFPVTLTSLYNEENKSLTDHQLSNKVQETFLAYSVTEHQIDNLFEFTKCQNVSPLWFDHRKGRITGTKAHDVLVRKETTPPDHLITRIMSYKSYDLSRKDAVKWGLDNESIAFQEYLQEMQSSNHKNFTCNKSGFRISTANSFMGATADGVLSCDCCGEGTLEIKCPYKYRALTVEEAAHHSDFCLDENLELPRNHRYYTQIQFQMLVFNCNYCDFVVMTFPSPDEVSMVIVRLPKDIDFCKLLLERCSLFLLEHVIPEILTRNIMDKHLENRHDKKDETKWCLCEEPEYGKMIFCDNEECKIGWFHYQCVNVKRKPVGKWFCPSCKKKKE